MKNTLQLLLVLGLSAVLGAQCSPVFTARVLGADGNSSGLTLAQALQNSSITHIIIVPDRLDVAVELHDLPPKFMINRCVLGCSQWLTLFLHTEPLHQAHVTPGREGTVSV